MKRTFGLMVLLGSLCVGGLALASDQYICTLTCNNASSVNSSVYDGGVACHPTDGGLSLGKDMTVSAQCSGTVNITAVSSSTGAATTKNTKLDVDQLFDIKMGQTDTHLACRGVSAAVECNISKAIR